MIKIAENRVAICDKCKSHLEYENEDILNKETSYDSYGELHYYEYKCIVCPKCGHEIIIY